MTTIRDLVLQVLDGEVPKPMRVIAEETGLERTSVAPTLSRLAADGLVIRAPAGWTLDLGDAKRKQRNAMPTTRDDGDATATADVSAIHQIEVTAKNQATDAFSAVENEIRSLDGVAGALGERLTSASNGREWIACGPGAAPAAAVPRGSPPSGGILAEASAIVYGDREETHGEPAKNLQAIAHIWTAILAGELRDGAAITPATVCLMMAGLKLARAANKSSHRDHARDIAGYIALMERCGYLDAEG